MPRCGLEDLRGGAAPRNAAVARGLLAGERGPVRDAVVLNAAAAIAVRSGLRGAADLAAGLRSGMEEAAEALDSGAAAGVLGRWVATSRELAGR